MSWGEETGPRTALSPGKPGECTTREPSVSFHVPAGGTWAVRSPTPRAPSLRGPFGRAQALVAP